MSYTYTLVAGHMSSLDEYSPCAKLYSYCVRAICHDWKKKQNKPHLKLSDFKAQ